jgi:NAD+ kinase
MKVGLVVNRGKQLAARFVPEFVDWLAAAGHEPWLAGSTARELKLKVKSARADLLVRKVDLVVALGGDGTLLRAARLVGARDVPIMGVNLGGLGFLTEFAADEARTGVAAFAGNRHSEERRMVLECRSGRRRGFALNDVAVNMGASNRVIDIIARHAGVLITRYVGDGVVVATPTGSTAYSLAAGGPVAYPTMAAILLTPLAPHALASRPLILPADLPVELVLGERSGSAVVTLDGQERWPLLPGRPVTVRRARFSIRLVTPRGKPYFEILRDKLKWTGSQRQ